MAALVRDIMGVGVIFFALGWLLLGVGLVVKARRPTERRLSVLLLVVTLVGAGIFVTQRLNGDNLHIQLDVGELLRGLIRYGVGAVVGLGLSMGSYVVTRMVSKESFVAFTMMAVVSMVIVYGGMLWWLGLSAV